MWSAIYDWLHAIFRGKAREHQRADFAAVSEQWETLATTLRSMLEDSLKRISELEKRITIIQDEAEQCLQERVKDAQAIADLKVRVAQLERKVDNGSH